MNDPQVGAFATATGYAPTSVLLVIASILITGVLLWVVWIAWGQYRAWHTGDVTAFDLLYSVLRAAVLLSVLGFYLRP